MYKSQHPKKNKTCNKRKHRTTRSPVLHIKATPLKLER